VLQKTEAEKTGERRVNRLKEDYEKKGYVVLTNETFNSGADIIIIDPLIGKIVKVIESTNYAQDYYYIQPKKFERYITELNKFDKLPNVEKELVVSFQGNLNQQQIDTLKSNNIRVKVEGHQD
jgi:hypothetical protein